MKKRRPHGYEICVHSDGLHRMPFFEKGRKTASNVIYPIETRWGKCAG